VGILAPTGTGIGSTVAPPPSGDAKSIPSSSPKMLNLICFSIFSEGAHMAAAGGLLLDPVKECRHLVGGMLRLNGNALNGSYSFLTAWSRA
jgi:hypothetical protein